MIEAVICFASGIAGGFALARVSRRKLGADAADLADMEQVLAKGETPLSWEQVKADLAPVAVMQSWRTLKHSARAESWQFMQDALIRDTMERTH